MIFAIIKNQTVENIAVYDGQSEWRAPHWFEVVRVPDGVAVSIGDRYENGAFVFTEPPRQSPTPEEIQAMETARLAFEAARNQSQEP